MIANVGKVLLDLDFSNSLELRIVISTSWSNSDL
jgi:hypothetical protein